MTSLTTTYWCYRCARFVRAWSHADPLSCPHCNSGFLEELPGGADEPDGDSDSSPGHIHSSDSPTPHPRFPASAMAMLAQDLHTPAGNSRPRRRRTPAAGDRSPFNPVIVLRGPTSESDGESNAFELYYDDGAGEGLRPLPSTMSDFLMGSGFDRLLEQLSHLEITGLGRSENPPASKAAIESMPRIEIDSDHIGSELHCAVCTDAFELGTEAREMPCKHVYHADCILPWLAMRNSCPVCRHKLPADADPVNSSSNREAGDDEPVGLTIWRLPGGGFAVGRFRRGADRELPGVYTEMDGGFVGTPRNVSWGLSHRRRERGGGIGRMLRNMVSFSLSLLGRSRARDQSTDSGSIRRSRSIGGFRRRRNRTWVLED